MKALLAALLLTATAVVQAGTIDPFQPHSNQYEVSWGSMGLGEGSITLSPLENGCYRYETRTKPLAIVRWTYGSPRETSEFCVIGDRIVPRHFQYQNDKRPKDGFTLDFDWKAKSLKVIKGGEVTLRELPDNGVDRQLMQLAVRQWVIRNIDNPKPEPIEFQLLDNRRARSYRFAMVGRQKVETPAGSYDTLLVERVNDPDTRMRFWIAPELGYVAVKVQRIEDGEVKLQMLLRK
ncbi:MAG TPA: DUF3108 domain-containing protein [Solimonas sp.]|nr:DUF3108 domain-containing protein [Solimonas sp.]